MAKDDLQLHKDKERGARAEALLNNDMLREAFKTLEQSYTRALLETEPRDSEARENYYRAINILSDIEKHLKKVMVDGKLAEKQLFELATKFSEYAA